MGNVTQHSLGLLGPTGVFSKNWASYFQSTVLCLDFFYVRQPSFVLGIVLVRPVFSRSTDLVVSILRRVKGDAATTIYVKARNHDQKIKHLSI